MMSLSWLSWFLFESFAALAAVLFTANFVLLVHWRRGGQVRPLLIGLVTALVLLALQAAVVTRREHAIRVLTLIENDIIRARTDALAASLSPAFDADRMDSAEFIAFVNRQYKSVKVRGVRRAQLIFQESLADLFTIEVSYQADISAEAYSGWFPTRWRITFARSASGWLIRLIQPTYIAGVPNPSWNQIDHH